MKIGAIVNLHSAGGRTGKMWPDIADSFDHMRVEFTRGPQHAAEITRRFLSEGIDRILAVGGDGTVHEVVNGWLDGDKPIRENASLAVLPLGTGSDYLKSLNLKDFQEAFDLAHSEQTFSPVDVGRVTYQAHSGRTETRLFMNVVSFGMGGEVALASKNVFSKISGKAGFQFATFKVFITYAGKTASVELDDQPGSEHRITNIAIGVGRYHGGGMHVCPRAALDDGLFEVTVIEKLSAYELVRDLPVLYSENLYVHPKVKHFRGSKIAAKSDQKVSIEVDGEALGTLPIETTIVPGVLRVVRK